MFLRKTILLRETMRIRCPRPATGVVARNTRAAPVPANLPGNRLPAESVKIKPLPQVAELKRMLAVRHRQVVAEREYLVPCPVTGGASPRHMLGKLHLDEILIAVPGIHQAHTAVFPSARRIEVVLIRLQRVPSREHRIHDIRPHNLRIRSAIHIAKIKSRSSSCSATLASPETPRGPVRCYATRG